MLCSSPREVGLGHRRQLARRGTFLLASELVLEIGDGRRLFGTRQAWIATDHLELCVDECTLLVLAGGCGTPREVIAHVRD
jgi:hypothetical protein